MLLWLFVRILYRMAIDMYELNEKLRELRPYDPGIGAEKIHLDANESFLPLPPEILEEVKTSLDRVEFNRYPDPAAKELCRAFAAYYGVPAENVTAGNGSDELITVLFTGFLSKGDAFATLEPDFSMYALNGFLHEARHVAIPRKESGLDIDKIIETCNNEDVKLLIFSNPGNPVSWVCPKEEVRRLIRGVNALVVLDEAYMDFSDQSLLPEFDRYDNLVILRTCSKAFGMAALRLGFAVAGKPLTDAIQAVKSPYNVNALSQAVGTAVLRKGEALAAARETILASRDQLLAGLNALEKSRPGKFELLPCATNFAALRLKDGEEARRFLWEKGVSVRYTGGLLRVTCGKPEENAAFLRCFTEYLDR